MTYIPTEFSTYLEQGKSNSKIQDEENGFLNLGDAAKILSKTHKLKVLAKHLHSLTETKHHAGVFKSQGKLKGRLVPMVHKTKLDQLFFNVAFLFSNQQVVKKS